MWNAWLDNSQTETKTAGRKINNLRYADNATVMAESRGTKQPLGKGERRLKKPGLKLNIQKTKIMASSPLHGK